MPQAPRSNDHHTYRCYLRGPDGIRGLSLCGPGAPFKVRKSAGSSQAENPRKSRYSKVFSAFTPKAGSRRRPSVSSGLPVQSPRVRDMNQARSPADADLDSDGVEPDQGPGGLG